MVWRGRSKALDRLWAALVYTLPLIDAVFLYSGPFRTMFPAIASVMLLPLMPFLAVYSFVVQLFSFGALSLGDLIIFFALYLLVIRNPRILHFIRFNVMQAILIGIGLSLFAIVWSLLGSLVAGSFIEIVLFNTLFLGTFVAVVYAIVQCIRGLYAEIPVISEAAYVQTRY